jgi:hypothetical protein
MDFSCSEDFSVVSLIYPFFNGPLNSEQPPNGSLTNLALPASSSGRSEDVFAVISSLDCVPFLASLAKPGSTVIFDFSASFNYMVLLTYSPVPPVIRWLSPE